MTKEETESIMEDSEEYREIDYEGKSYRYRYFPRKKRLDRDDITSVVSINTLDKLLLDSGELKRIRGNKTIIFYHRKLSIPQIVYILKTCYGINVGIDTLQDRRRFLKKTFGLEENGL
jgi:hypothetical protein